MTRRPSNRAVLVAGLLLALLIAGVASHYASSPPDGLEHVAQQTGIHATAQDSAVADSPLADYQTRGVSNERLSGGLAGILGALAVLVIGAGLFRILRPRDAEHEGDAESQESRA